MVGVSEYSAKCGVLLTAKNVGSSVSRRRHRATDAAVCGGTGSVGRVSVRSDAASSAYDTPESERLCECECV